MSPKQTMETLVDSIETMNRNEVIDNIIHFKGPVRLDFTESFLSKLDLDKLRHILFAAISVSLQKIR